MDKTELGSKNSLWCRTVMLGPTVFSTEEKRFEYVPKSVYGPAIPIAVIHDISEQGGRHITTYDVPRERNVQMRYINILENCGQ